MMNLFFSTAYAQTAGAPAGAPNPLISLLPFVAIFVVFYFLMIRPQQKKIKQEEAMLKELKHGDEVYMKSGVLGKIHSLTEKVITLEIAENVKVKFFRNQVGGLSKPLLEEKKE